MSKNREQTGKADRRVHVRHRRWGPPRHDDLVNADKEVLEIFDTLQNSWRHQRINHLMAAERRTFVMERERDRERKTWTRLARYLTAPKMR